MKTNKNQKTMEARATKVIKTETYIDSQRGAFTVCKGKIILIEITRADRYEKPQQSIHLQDGKCYKAIVISETEKIEWRDIVLDNQSKTIKVATMAMAKTDHDIHWSKILALPENFSPKQLMAIVDGKMKDGDEVLIDCKSVEYKAEMITSEEPLYTFAQIINIENNHIKLFPVKKQNLNSDDFRNFIRTYQLSNLWEKFLKGEVAENEIFNREKVVKLLKSLDYDIITDNHIDTGYAGINKWIKEKL